LRECIEQLTALETSRAILVSHLREALQEQVNICVTRFFFFNFAHNFFHLYIGERLGGKEELLFNTVPFAPPPKNGKKKRAKKRSYSC